MKVSSLASINESSNSHVVSERLPTGILEAKHMSGATIDSIAEFASRYNNKRHFLIASRLLGKYIPAKPSVVTDAQNMMAEKANVISKDAMFIGFAESCSGFGEGVFESFIDIHPDMSDNCAYIHTTRQFNDTHNISIAFKEEHSHAVNQVIISPEGKPKEIFEQTKTIVIIEDEITTGNTIKNFLNEYISTVNSNVVSVIILTLIDIRTIEQKTMLSLAFPQLQITTQSMCTADLSFYKKHDNDIFKPKRSYLANSLPIPLELGRNGIMRQSKNIDEYVKKIMPMDSSTPVTVIGTSEYTNLSRKIGLQLEEMGFDVETLATTRAPLKVGNAIKSKMTFNDHYGDGVEHYLYNFDTNRVAIFVYESEAQAAMHKDLHESLKSKVIVGSL